MSSRLLYTISHSSFCNKYDLELNLLADPEGIVATHFGFDIGDGKPARTTFIISNGSIQAVYNNVKPDGHSDAVLSKLNEILEKDSQCVRQNWSKSDLIRHMTRVGIKNWETNIYRRALKGRFI